MFWNYISLAICCNCCKTLTRRYKGISRYKDHVKILIKIDSDVGTK